MANVALVLGDVSFQGFEIPASIGLSGEQRLAVHRLMSGAQVIDVLGRGAEKVAWQGTLTGNDAAARACELDRLRLDGSALLLNWDIYSFLVLVESFSADYRSPWWIPYQLSCAIVQDLSSPVADAVVGTLDLISSDLGVAAGFANVAGFQSAMADGAIVAGTAGYAAALAAGVSAQASLDEQLQGAANGLSGGFSASLMACGSMANLAAGRGYLARAVSNLTNLEP